MQGRSKGRVRGSVGETLEGLKGRFEVWRRVRRKGEAVPGELVKAAKGLVGRYRPGPLAKALGLHYRKLVAAPAIKNAVDGQTTGKKGLGGSGEWPISEPKVPTFVRVALPENPASSPTPNRGGAGSVEFETPRGFKARVNLERISSGMVVEVLKAMGGGRE